MHLTDVKVEGQPSGHAKTGEVGVTIPIHVTEKGKFEASFDGETYDSDNLSSLEYQLRDAVRAARVEVPFVIETGRRGVIRGYHGGKRAVLVTWDSGAKGDLPTYHPVFKEGALTDEEIEELRRLHEQADQIKARIAEIKEKHVDANELLSEKLGEDLTDYSRERKWREEREEATA